MNTSDHIPSDAPDRIARLAEAFTKRRWLFPLLVLAAFFFFNLPQLAFRDVGYNTAVHLADSFLQGRLDVDPPEEPLDLIEYNGRYYVPFPPLPALLLTPLVAVFGNGLNPLWLTPLLGMLTAAAMARLFRRLTQSEEIGYALSTAMVFGTAYWLCVRYAFDTYLAHMVAVLALTLALLECTGRRRGWLVGLCIGAACASRQLTLFSAPFFLAWLWFPPRAPASVFQRLRPCLGAVAALGLVLLGLMAYNHARFGSPFEDGYAWVIEETWYAYRLERWGNLNWRYIPTNFLRMFVMGFTIQFEPPSYMIPQMSPWGTSLTFASPFIFFAFAGKLPAPRLVQRLGWICAGAILLPILLHKSAGGGWQINGMRYTLDFLPLISLYAAMGMKRYDRGVGRRLWLVLIAYAIALNGLAIALTHTRHFFPG